MARPTSNLGLILRGNVQWARMVIPRDVRAVMGKTEFLESLGNISECEAAAKAFPIRKAWAEQIARARSGTYCKAIEAEVVGPLKPLAFPSIRGVSADETSFWALIEVWKNKRNIDNHRTIGR